MIQPYPFFPGDSLDLGWDWGAEWLEPGETIQSAVVIAGPNIVVNSFAATPLTVTANVTLNAAAPLGNETHLKCRVTTTAVPPRVVTRAMRIVSAFITVEGDPE